MLERDVEPVVVGFLQILRIPDERRSAHTKLRPGASSQNRIERVGGRWIWIREGLLGDTLQWRQRALIARHAIERGFQEDQVFRARVRRSRRILELRGNNVQGVAEPESRLVVDLVRQAGAGLQRKLLWIPHAGMGRAGEIPLPVPRVVVAAAHDGRGRGRHDGRVARDSRVGH